ncbi:hypothetical protein A1F99_119550 [Pyrenophora tritici-repentis]|nr:hypothetical protein A1F99_119550 [Pyrenophora tritici-repentis]
MSTSFTNTLTLPGILSTKQMMIPTTITITKANNFNPMIALKS